MKTKDDIIRDNPLVPHIEQFGIKLRGSGNQRTANRCAQVQHRNDHFPMSVNAEKQIWHCHDCKQGGSIIDFVMLSEGLTLSDAFKKLGGAAERQERPSQKATPSAYYDYEDEAGVLLYQVVRFEPKTFRQRKPVEGGDWEWSMEGVRRVLYKLPKWKPEPIIYVVEGEKDADNLWKLGFPATCNVGGAGKWLDSYTENLKGKHVVIFPDNDDPGRSHAKLVATSLAGKALSIRQAEVPSPDKDVSDFIRRIGEDAKAQIQKLIDAAKEVSAALDLPIKSMVELEAEYIAFTKKVETVSFSFYTWLPKLGTACRALVPGELVVIMADTGVGKSALLQNIAVYAHMPVLFFELELPDTLMFERFMSIEGSSLTAAEVFDTYKSGNKIDFSFAHLNHIYVCDKAKITPQELEKFIELSELKIGQRPGMVIVDYLGLMNGQGRSRYERVSELAEQMKVIAKSTKTVMVLGTQIHRPNSERKSAEVFLHDAKDSGSIENSAGLVLGAWREGDHGEKLKLKILKNTKGKSGLIVDCLIDNKLRVTQEGLSFITPSLPYRSPDEP